MISAAHVFRTGLRTVRTSTARSARVPNFSFPAICRKPSARFVSQTPQLDLVLPNPDIKVNDNRRPDEETQLKTTPIKAPPRTKSLHVAPVDPKTTSDEFRQAFAELEGLRAIDFTPGLGPRRVKNKVPSNFGVLHFEDEDSAAKAMLQCRQNPVWIHGLQTELAPRTSKLPPPGEKSHVLSVGNLPQDLRYEEVAELLGTLDVKYKSIRFMVNKDGGFHGSVNIICDSIPAAVEVHRLFLNSKLRDTTLLEQDFGYVRPLFEDQPTTRLMVKGIPKSQEAIDRIRDIANSVTGMVDFRVVRKGAASAKGPMGYAIVDCKDIPSAWRTIEQLNRHLPYLRTVFMPHRSEDQQKSAGARGEGLDPVKDGAAQPGHA